MTSPVAVESTRLHTAEGREPRINQRVPGSRDTQRRAGLLL